MIMTTECSYLREHVNITTTYTTAENYEMCIHIVPSLITTPSKDSPVNSPLAWTGGGKGTVSHI